jgi:UDP-glucose 4-epimerase
VNVRKFVVTGASGHLGRSVVQRLAVHGEVVALSRAGLVPPAPYGKQAVGSVRGLAFDVESDACVDILRAELASDVALVHLAGWHPPRTAGTGPTERTRLMAANVLGTMRVLEAARRSDGGRAPACIVYASTFEVYGIPKGSNPVSESARLDPITDYGASKLAGEDHLMAFAYEEKVRVVALRLPAIYGPGEVTARALPNFLKSVLEGERPKIFGTGRDLRDQVHVDDAALAVEVAVCSNAEGIFNIADGEAHSIEQLAQTAMQVAELTGAPELLPADKPQYDFHMSIERARRELGFAPRVALADGMREQLAWLRARA